MKKILLTAVFALCAANVYAAQKPDFSSEAFTRQLTAVPAAAQAAADALPAPVPARAKIGRYVQVSGYVTLTGNGFMPQGGGFTSVTLTGWATFRDGSGQITSNNTYINTYASMWLRPNQSVFQSVSLNVFAQFTRNGKPLGSSNMTGSVSVNGWPSSNYVMLNGSGYLNGSIYVTDEE